MISRTTVAAASPFDAAMGGLQAQRPLGPRPPPHFLAPGRLGCLDSIADLGPYWAKMLLSASCNLMRGGTIHSSYRLSIG